MGFLVAIGILYAIYKIYEAISNESMRQDCAKKGYDTYPDKDGHLRDVTNNRKCFVDPRTGKKTYY